MTFFLIIYNKLDNCNNLLKLYTEIVALCIQGFRDTHLEGSGKTEYGPMNRVAMIQGSDLVA